MSESEPEELDEELVKAIAANAVKVFGDSYKLIISEHSTSYKWLLASLLTLNSAAAFAIFSIDQIDLQTKFSSGLAFYVGIVCALLIAVLGQFANRKLIGPIVEYQEYWIEVQVTGEMDVDRKDEIDGKLQEALKSNWMPRTVGYVSAIAFSIGLGISAYGASSTAALHPNLPKPVVETRSEKVILDSREELPAQATVEK